jgi:hypothetical protein
MRKITRKLILNNVAVVGDQYGGSVSKQNTNYISQLAYYNYPHSVRFKKTVRHRSICSFFFQCHSFQFVAQLLRAACVRKKVLVHLAVNEIRNHPPTILRTPLYISHQASPR